MAHAAGLLQDSLNGLNLRQFFVMHCRDGLLTSKGANVGQISDEVAKLGREMTVGRGHQLFGYGEAPDSFYLILKVCI